MNTEERRRRADNAGIRLVVLPDVNPVLFSHLKALVNLNPTYKSSNEVLNRLVTNALRKEYAKRYLTRHYREWVMWWLSLGTNVTFVCEVTGECIRVDFKDGVAYTSL